MGLTHDQVRERLFNHPWRNPVDRDPVPRPEEDAPGYHWDCYWAEHEFDRDEAARYYAGFDCYCWLCGGCGQFYSGHCDGVPVISPCPCKD